MRHTNPCDMSAKVSYAPGATLSLAMLRMRPEAVRRILVADFLPQERLHEAVLAEAERLGIPVSYTDEGMIPGKTLQPGEKVFSIAAQYEQWEDVLLPGCHIVLVNPADIRNVGAIMRSALAFGLHDMAVISEEFDSFSPRLCRASMGARARIRAERFDTIGDYIARFPLNMRYAFMLDAAEELGRTQKQEPFSLIFGNELTGLPPQYAQFCTPVFIEQGDELDSLNISVAAGIALYSFTRLKNAEAPVCQDQLYHSS